MLRLAVKLVLSGRTHRSSSRARGWWIAIGAVIVAGVVAYRYVLPGLVASRVERMLQAHGFPGAHVQVSSIGLEHLQLIDVTLGDGLALGTVELDAGISLLWRSRFHELTIRDAKLAAGMPEGTPEGMPERLPERLIARLSRPSRDASGSGLPFDVVRIASSVVTIGGVRAQISGTITPAANTVSVDLEATSDLVKLGNVELRDVHATIRDAGGGLRACVAGRLLEAAVEVCSTLPHTIDEIRELRAVDATFRASAPAWQLHGRGTLGWASTLALTGGHVDVTAPALATATATAGSASLAADLAGNLARLEFDVSGTVQADHVELRERAAFISAHMVRLPLVARVAFVDGALRVTPRKPVVVAARDASIRSTGTVVELVQPSIAAYDAGRTITIDATFAAPRALRWSAVAARVGAAHLKAPSGSLVARRTLHWRATEVEWRGARFREPAGVSELGASQHTATWAAATGPGSFELGAGEIRFHRTRDQWALDYGRSAALGGELVLEPAVAALHQPIELILHARNLELHHVLAAFAHGHADGSGVLDGDLAIQINDAGPSVTHGALRARAPGGLQLSDAEWRKRASASATGFALHQRIAATLSDFTYSRLSAVLQPAGADPELQVMTEGRGKRVAQDLDLVINLRGVRDAARRLPFAQSLRSKP